METADPSTRRAAARGPVMAGGAVLCVLLMAAGAARAEADVDADGEGEGAWPVVRCESTDLDRVHCPMDTRNDVTMVRQLSQNACIRESDWGVDAQGVWVARGCRAEFQARAATTVTRRMIRCESSGGRTRSCPVALRGDPVRLLRQVSVLPCRRDESWGVGRNEVWVSRGCKGEFEIGDRQSGFPPGPRLLTCESKGQLRRECGTTVERGVTLARQLSGMACEEGRSWGWDREKVWVDKGCRAQFSVD